MKISDLKPGVLCRHTFNETMHDFFWVTKHPTNSGIASVTRAKKLHCHSVFTVIGLIKNTNLHSKSEEGHYDIKILSSEFLGYLPLDNEQINSYLEVVTEENLDKYSK